MAGKKQSAGILLFKKEDGKIKVLLIHPGGPFWLKKDLGAWSIPKGEFEEEENALTCAKREFSEETGGELNGNFIPLKSCRQKSGKIIHAWAVQGSFDPKNFKSNNFTIEWPPRSGKMSEFPEADKAEWFELGNARAKINSAQVSFIDQLETLI